MYVKVKSLRAHGKRRTDHEIAADLGKTGELTLAMVGPAYELNLNDPNSSVHAPLLPILFEAKLTTMGGERMLFKGEERPQGDAGLAFVQEWSVQVVPR